LDFLSGISAYRFHHPEILDHIEEQQAGATYKDISPLTRDVLFATGTASSGQTERDAMVFPFHV